MSTITVKSCEDCPLHDRDSYYGSVCAHPNGPGSASGSIKGQHNGEPFPKDCPLLSGPTTIEKVPE